MAKTLTVATSRSTKPVPVKNALPAPAVVAVAVDTAAVVAAAAVVEIVAVAANTPADFCGIAGCGACRVVESPTPFCFVSKPALRALELFQKPAADEGNE